MIRGLGFGLMAAFLVATPAHAWTHYGGDQGGTRFVDLDQIDADNVDDLEIAWEYQTGDLENRPQAIHRSAFEGTPIINHGNLVFCTPFNEIVALDPGTGQERWRFDAQIATNYEPANQYVCRGVTPWDDANLKMEDAACAHRLFMGTADYRLIAVDALTGLRCQDFGTGGQVQIDPGMELLWPGEFQITSPPAVIGDIVIVGSAIGDNARVEAPKGTVRAYDARTGEPAWTFDPIPLSPDDPDADSYGGDLGIHAGHANVWSIMAVDEERDLVFLPTSSPSPDFYGGLRPGNNNLANSVVAVRGSTGEVVWSFQTVHHDIWDFDVSAQPLLTTLHIDGEDVPVVVQNTKMGFVFVLHRETGEPIFPVEERAVPQSAVLGEWLSPTQPFPTSPPPLHPIGADAAEPWGFTFWDRGACRRQFAALSTEGIYTPPTEEGILMYPFTGGGANWGSAAFDETRQIMVVGINRMVHQLTMIPADEVVEARNHLDMEVAIQRGAPFGMSRDLIMSPFGAPCSRPPWGTVMAVDLSNGEVLWTQARGTTEDLVDFLPALPTGEIALGGVMITNGGLIFEAGTLNYRIRARDIETGRVIWSHRLPAGAPATPMSYEYDGRQYVVIASGGYSRIGTAMGDSIIAFALPE